MVCTLWIESINRVPNMGCCHLIYINLQANKWILIAMSCFDVIWHKYLLFSAFLLFHIFSSQQLTYYMQMWKEEKATLTCHYYHLKSISLAFTCTFTYIRSTLRRLRSFWIANVLFILVSKCMKSAAVSYSRCKAPNKHFD